MSSNPGNNKIEENENENENKKKKKTLRALPSFDLSCSGRFIDKPILRRIGGWAYLRIRFLKDLVLQDTRTRSENPAFQRSVFVTFIRVRCILKINTNKIINSP